jgi:hypothetical protein
VDDHGRGVVRDGGDDLERLRAEWRAADVAYEEAIRQGRAPIEVQALLHRKQRLEAAYFEKALKQSR